MKPTFDVSKCGHCQATVLPGDRSCRQCGALLYRTELINLLILLGIGLMLALPLAFPLSILISFLYHEAYTPKLFLRSYTLILFLYIAFVARHFLNAKD